MRQLQSPPHAQPEENQELWSTEMSHLSSERYSVRLQVRFLDVHQIQGLDDVWRSTHHGVTLTVEKNPPILLITASGFSSEKDAEAYVERLKRGLWNLSIKFNAAFEPNLPKLKVTWFDESTQPNSEALRGLVARSDGILAETQGYAVFPTGARVAYSMMGRPEVRAGIAWNSMEGTFLAGLGGSGEIETDTQLETAVELYLVSFRERSAEARFITLVSCLEVLAPKMRRPIAIGKMFDGFSETLAKRKMDLEASLRGRPSTHQAVELEELQAIDRLQSDTGWKKMESISYRVKRLAESVEVECESKKREFVEDVVAAYRIRSQLLHSGKADKSDLDHAGKTVMEAVKLLIEQRLGLPPSE